MRKLVLDPGHGGDRAAAGSSPRGVQGPLGTLEKDVTLALARRLRGHLEPDVSVALTRDADVNLPLAERAALARQQGADAFLSLHANGGRRAGRGAETWIHPGAPASTRALAGRVQQALSSLGGPSRGVKVGALGVIEPARLGGADGCLVEVDFLSDVGGERRLRDDANLDRIARALAGAVRGHLAPPRYGRAPSAAAQTAPTVAPSPCDHRHELTKGDLPQTLAFVQKHLKTAADDKVSLVLRANAIPDDATELDVIVHLHGHSKSGAQMSLLDKEVDSGLDFCDPEDATNPYTWRERPTLGILPHGRHDGGEVYTFPAFATAAGLRELIDFSLGHLAAQLGRDAFTLSRLILTAHSGGGGSAMAVLGHTDPDEVHLFDATYSSTANLETWMRRHLSSDAQRVAADPADGVAGAMRVVYLPGTKTAPAAEACHRALVAALRTESATAYLLCPFYRVEHSRGEAPVLTHGNMPRRLGWQFLYAASADTIPTLARPAPPVPCAAPAPAAAVPETTGLGVPTASALDASSDVDFMLSRIEELERALVAGRIPRLTDLAPELLDSTAYEASGRDDEYTDHRTRLESVVSQINTWILDTAQSAIGQIEDETKRRHFLDEIDWKRQGFPGNNEGPDAESRALFAAMAQLVPERRVPQTLTYHNVDGVVVAVDGQPRHHLYPPAADAFSSMHMTATADGVALTIVDSHRSQATQDQIKKSQPNPGAVAQKRSAHTYGLAVDLAMSVGGLRFTETHTHSMTNLVGMYKSPAYKWMYVNGERYGFFPYSWEPWHWEYNPAGFKAEFEAKTFGRGGGCGEEEPVTSVRRYVPPRRPSPVRSVALDDRTQIEQRQAVLANARRSLIAAENTRYDQVHFDSGRVNFGIGSWTGGHIPELFDFYSALATELGREQQLFDHFILPGAADGHANFDDIRARFVTSGAATVLSANEQAAFRRLGADTDLRDAQDRKMDADVEKAIQHVYDQNVYPFIDGYMAAISELAAIVLVHVEHQHGQSRDLIRNVVANHGGDDALGQAIVDGTLTETQFLRDVSQQVIDRVKASLKQGVRNRYDKLFRDFGSSDSAFFFAPPAAEGQAYWWHPVPQGRGPFRTTPDLYS